MKLADLRALPVGAPLLAGLAAEPVVLAGFTPPGPGRRYTTARILTVLGDERDVQPRLLAPAPPASRPDTVVVRPDLAGHTITVERITARIWPRLGVGRGAVGQFAVIERRDGHLGKVCCIASDLWGGGSIETAADSYARDYGATYVPAGGA
ncbi:hypothetical protein ACFOY4_01555 [Actinomadura syzygii]|uniref:Uncharacterized protein n=1 Tax=Actinomadura syzygii TaxID=1427538 RepID=A0A5D0TR09_9ACTN|nr:hypothetical protein [Actinomadura syzygii]TYC08568.1 hypothetical protein FXF65_37370 [Actinomadura syzygii]